MAEFLVAARDLDSGYRRGDPVTVQDDGWSWGAAETLPDFWVIKTPNITLPVARQAVCELWEPAQAGDPELLAPDVEDRQIRRGRRLMRLFTDELPQRTRRRLDRTGVISLELNEARAIARRLRYNRTSRRVEDSGIREFG